MKHLIFLCAVVIALISCKNSAPIAANSRIAVVEFDSAPLVRAQYTQLVHQIAKSKPAVIFLHVAFIDSTIDSTDTFASDLNSGTKVISEFILYPKPQQGKARPDYRPLLGQQIQGIPSTEPLGFWEYQDIELPYPDLIAKSRGITFPFELPDNKGVISYLGFYAFHNGFLYENAAITVTNAGLAESGQHLGLSSDKLSLDLTGSGMEKVIATRRSVSQPLGMDIAFADLKRYRANDILEGKVHLPEGSIVLIGTADGDTKKTSNGAMPGVLLLANEVNTLLQAALDSKR